jgi:hypothetical protein
MATGDERSMAAVPDPEQERSKGELKRVWAAVERVRERNADKSPDEILEDVTAEVEAVRQERYERREAAGQSSIAW